MTPQRQRSSFHWKGSPLTFHFLRRADWIVMATSLAITVVVTLYVVSSVNKVAEQVFVSDCDEVQRITKERFDDHVKGG